MGERAAFEANIDANPLDATNHLVFADWLQEQGHDDEAAFRRSMGEWIHKNPGLGSKSHPYNSQNWWVGGKMGYPEGVTLQSMDFPRQTGYPDSPQIDRDAPDDLPAAHRNRDHGDDPSSYGHIAYRSYRGTETAFRRAFMTNRPARLSRRAVVRRYTRKK